jgi:hypothetical protein
VGEPAWLSNSTRNVADAISSQQSTNLQAAASNSHKPRKQQPVGEPAWLSNSTRNVADAISSQQSTNLQAAASNSK